MAEGLTQRELLKLITALPRDKVRDVRDYCTMLLALKGDGDSVVENVNTTLVMAKGDDLAIVVLDCIVEHMKSKGADTTNRTLLMKTAQYDSFSAKFRGAPSLTTYFYSVIENNKVQRIALIRTAVSLLYENLILMGVPISSRAMMSHVHRLPSILNQAFPGYAQSGMLRLVIRNQGDDNAGPQ